MATKNETGSLTADREITITRLLNAPRELVFELWTQPEHIKHWWGPNGFTNTIYKMDVKPGGHWEFTMHGPDGTDYRNHNVFEEITWPEKIVLQHASGPNFKMTITFTAQGDKTLLHITSLFESAEQLKEVVREFKADEGLKQNVDRLETYLQQMPFAPDLVLTRIINALVALVFDAWTKPEHLQNWWGPKDFTNPVCRADAKPGGAIYIDMTAPDGTPHPCRGSYHELLKPERIVFSITSYQDESGIPALDVFYVVNLEELNGKTKLTLTCKIMRATPEMAQAIAGMEEGWSQSLDRLVNVTDNHNPTPLVIERTYNAPIEKVWKAISNNAEMAKWYLKLADFKPEVGFEFEFYGGKDEQQYRHLCKVTEVVTGVKLTYSWRFDGYPGNSFVTWELFAEGDKTRLKLTHSGIETFPQGGDLDRNNFFPGWAHLIGTLLKQFVEA